MISKTANIYTNVLLGNDARVEDFAIIGVPAKGLTGQAAQVHIGDRATIRSHTVIYAGNNIGHDFVTGNKANIREANVIGDKVSIGTLSVVEHQVTIGNGVRIHSQVFIPEYTIIEDGCWIGPNVVFTNAKYPNRAETKSELTGCVVEQGAIIGANSTILPGVCIGGRALVAAGALVTEDVAPGMVVMGHPARPVKKIKDLPYQ